MDISCGFLFPALLLRRGRVLHEKFKSEGKERAEKYKGL